MESTITKEEALIVVLLVILFFDLIAALWTDSID